jgi:hypothetical protein
MPFAVGFQQQTHFPVSHFSTISQTGNGSMIYIYGIKQAFGG